MRVSVRLEGFNGVGDQLSQLKRATAKTVLKRAATTALRPMAAIAAALAPKDTGDLEKSIKVSAKGGGNTTGNAEFGAVMRAGGSKAEARLALRDARRGAGIGDHAVELFMGPAEGTRDEAIKAIVQEFGSVKQAPQAYMRPAWDADKSAVLSRLGPLLWAEVEKTLSRIAARSA